MEPVPLPRMLVRSSSCAVGMCIYCSCRKALAGSSWLRLGYTGPGDAAHAGWGDSWLPHPAVPSDPQRDNVVFETWARPSVQHSLVCAVPRSLKTLWPTHDDPRKNVQQCGTSCHCTLAEGSHTVGLYTQSSRAHSLCVFPILPRVLPLLQVGFLLVFFSLRHRHWKRSTGFETWAKNSSWILRSGWMTLRISVFESDALLGQPSLIPTADGTLSHSFWGDCKLRWYQAVFMESCHVPEPAGTRSP